MLERSLKQLQGLVSVSQGEIGADFLFVNGRVVNVYTGEILEGNVATYKNRIAYIGPSDKMASEHTSVLDVHNLYLVPGFIDAHCHADMYSHPASFTEGIVRFGTTTILADAQDMTSSLGIEGFKKIMRDSFSYPARIFFLAPAVGPPFPDVEGDETIDTVELSELLKNDQVKGLGEITPYPRLLAGDSGLLSRVALALNLGKTVEGHTVGASYNKLNSLVASGLTSCHESITPEDLLMRLRLGLYTMVRCGSVRSELKSLAFTLQDPRVSHSHRVLLVTDNMFPDALVERGHMNYVISEATKLGINPIQAIQMSTINPALYLGLDRDLGAIAPGRIADILAVESLEQPAPKIVLQDGRLVVDQGKLILPPLAPPKTRDEGKPFFIKKALPEMFEVKAPEDRGQAIPVISIVDKTITRRKDLQLPIMNGLVQAQPEKDILKVAVLLRNGRKWNGGFVTGLGAGFDALSSSLCHEIHEILVIGGDDCAMMQAVDRLLEIKGGIVLVKEGKIIHELPLPIGGIMSEKSLENIAKDLMSTKKVIWSLGSPLEDPLLTIIFLTFTSLVDVRITVSGVYDVKKGKIIFDSKGTNVNKS